MSCMKMTSLCHTELVSVSKKITLAVIALLFISGAAHADTLTISEKSWQKKGKYYEYSISIPQVHGLKSADVDKFNTDMQKMADEMISEFAMPEDNIYEEYSCDRIDEDISYEVADKNSFGVLSIKVYVYMYSCGAHGNTGVRIFNINKKSGKLLKFDDVFATGADKYFEKEITKQMNEDPDSYFTEIKPDVRSANFYFEGDDVVFVFGQYAIAPYVTGMPEFRFNKDNIKRWLKKAVEK